MLNKHERRILDAIDHPSHESYVQAHVYAFLACIFNLLAAETELLSLWFNQRALTRVRSELMAAVFDKSLKRKDYSAIVDKEKEAAVKDARCKTMTSISTLAGEICIISAGLKTWRH